MDTGTWVGVIFEYVCPSCVEADRQKFVFHVERYDDKQILRSAHSLLLPCTRCNAELPPDLTFQFDICPAPLEKLRELGYPAPPVH